MSHPLPPVLPPIGTVLAPERTLALIESFRTWSASTGARLLDLDSLLTSLPTSAAQDHTLAFVLWQATDKAITEAHSSSGATADVRLAPMRAAVLGTDGSVLAHDTVEACTIICALIDSCQVLIDRHDGALAATAGVSSDLAAAAPLVKSLSMSASLHSRLLERSADPSVASDDEALAQLVRDAAGLRAELEAADRERTALLAEHRLDAQRLEDLRVLEQEARSVAATANAKVSGLALRGIVSVDALGPAPDLSATPNAPWPAHRTLLVNRSTKLNRAGSSLRQVIETNRSALAERNELRQVVDAFRAKAMASRIGELPDVNEAYRAAHDVLWTAPTDLVVARSAVATYQRVVNERIAASVKPVHTTPRPSSEVHR